VLCHLTIPVYLAPMLSPDSFSLDGPPLQADVFDHNHTAIPSQPPLLTKLKLSVLERNYRQSHKYAALLHLTESAYLEIDDEYKYPNDGRRTREDGPIVMDINQFYLDFVLYVSRYAGLGAIIPTVVANHDWTFTLSLMDQHHNFSPKHSLIGFETTGRMVYLGRCQQESVWIAFAPDKFVTQQCKPLPPGTTFPAPHVTAAQHRKFCLFIAKCLADLGIGGIYCTNQYADVTSSGEFEGSTNLL
jgi:hypothetical protein